MNRFVHALLCLLCVFVAPIAGAQLPMPENPLWEPVVDEVYLQEVGTRVPADEPILSVAVYGSNAYVGDADGVSTVTGTTFVPMDGPAGPIRELLTLGDALWAVAADGLWRFDGRAWDAVSDAQAADVCLHNGAVVLASNAMLYAIEEDSLEPLLDANAQDLKGVVSYAGTLYVHDGRRVGLVENRRIEYEEIADWGTMQRGAAIRDLLSIGSRLYVATNEGLGLLRGMTWYRIDGDDGLCYEDTTSLAMGFDRDMWIGTSRGAIRHVGDEFQFFGHERWIPHNRVNAIASGDNVVYIATDGGLGIVEYEPYTLAKKAAYYERLMDEWSMKRLGFVHILFKEDGRWVREVSDNDVGYSSHYLHAKCFEYAVTGSEEARAEAVNMMKSVKWSEEITPIEGFPARSIYARGEVAHKAMHGSGGLPAEWHPSANGKWEWKGDTSSDEIDAHVYETNIFLSLVANEEERVWATDHLRRVVGHIVDNGFFLRDMDGKPTRWARWDPEYLQTPYGYYARGLNGMEAFNYLTTAYHYTDDEKFKKAKQFHLEQGYLDDIVRQKLAFHPGEWTWFDDRLAFYAYFPLISHETDPELKAVWLRSLERSWEIKRSEAVPWFNFIYGALTGNDCEVDRAVDHLRAWPLDLRRYAYTNSHRDDLHMPDGYRMYAQRPKPLTPREQEPLRWDGDFMRLDGGYKGGGVVCEPGGWLDAYWMGRYYGMITPPQTDDPSLTTVPERNAKFGAEPYDGPERPKLWHEQ